jgi:sortase (surface protein transpeptidase)
VIFTTASGRFTYKVTQTLIVGARDVWVVNPTPDATFTIMACHPKGSARQRYVVKGTLVAAPPPPPKPSPPTTKFLGLL